MSYPSHPTPIPPRPFSASDLFASQHGQKCSGPEHCHWCGAPCERKWPHDEPAPVPFQRTSPEVLRRVSRPYVCYGCHIYARQRVTVPFLSGGFKDPGKIARGFSEWSWWLTELGCWGVRLEDVADRKSLLKLLLKPPLRFALSLLDGDKTNYLYKATSNDHKEVKADTRLLFTLDGTPHSYSVYELERSTKDGPAGKDPGVGLLCLLLHIEEPVVKEVSKHGPAAMQTHPGKQVVRKGVV